MEGLAGHRGREASNGRLGVVRRYRHRTTQHRVDAPHAPPNDAYRVTAAKLHGPAESLRYERHACRVGTRGQSPFLAALTPDARQCVNRRPPPPPAHHAPLMSTMNPVPQLSFSMDGSYSPCLRGVPTMRASPVSGHLTMKQRTRRADGEPPGRAGVTRSATLRVPTRLRDAMVVAAAAEAKLSGPRADGDFEAANIFASGEDPEGVWLIGPRAPVRQHSRARTRVPARS